MKTFRRRRATKYAAYREMSPAQVALLKFQAAYNQFEGSDTGIAVSQQIADLDNLPHLNMVYLAAAMYLYHRHGMKYDPSIFKEPESRLLQEVLEKINLEMNRENSEARRVRQKEVLFAYLDRIQTHRLESGAEPLP